MEATGLWYKKLPATTTNYLATFNLAKQGRIGDLRAKEALRTHYECKKVPGERWDFGMNHNAGLRPIIPRGLSRKRTPTELMTGNTPDITHLLNFSLTLC